ncbi:hypothetical protein [Stenotrophomonas maltophilia]|uniref:hypothetical protein n=1 Tax=Stenotrophomonas maltophilia TaxID=40324 RepID=UPI003D7D10FE
MSAPVDVLAAMDLSRECLRNSSQQTPDGQAIHSAAAQARAAVAEVIEAGDRLTAAFRALGLDSSLINRSRLARECEESMVAFDVALARVKGGVA